MTLTGFLEAARSDAGVDLTFTVTNEGDDPVELTFPSGFQADFVVLNGDREVWRWSDDRAFVQAIATETLAPGASLTFEETCPDPGEGAFVVEATLQAIDVDVSARVGLSR